jgi:predicted transcriptional regulator
LAILRVLWELGPATVRQVQEQLRDQRGTGYTTTLKLMQIMLEKGLLRRDESAQAHIYEAVARQGATQRLLVRDLIDRVFDGSARQLILQALSSRKATPGELDEIRNMLDKLEKDQT